MSLKGRSCWDVNILMDDAEESSLESIGRLVAAREEIRFEAEDRQLPYCWVEQGLVGREHGQLSKAARGLVRRNIEKMIGLSQTQVTRMIVRFTSIERVQARVYRRRRFTQLDTPSDIELRASVDEARETLSGLATLLSGHESSTGDPGNMSHPGRKFEAYKRPEYAPGSHLRRSPVHFAPPPALPRAASQPHQDAAPAVSISERGKPQLQGQVGSLRLDTVHQGDHGPEPGRERMLRCAASPLWPRRRPLRARAAGYLLRHSRCGGAASRSPTGLHSLRRLHRSPRPRRCGPAPLPE